MKKQGIGFAIALGVLCVIHCNALNDTGEVFDMKPRSDLDLIFKMNTKSQANKLLRVIIWSIQQRKLNDTGYGGAVNAMIRKKTHQGTSRTERSAVYINETKYVKRNHENQLTICERVTCYNDTQIKPCKVNFTADICEPCPPGTTIYDITTSMETVLKCLPKHRCHHFPGTVHTKELHACAGDVTMFCRCNTEDGICGLDPCNCRKVRCSLGETLLQNCTCVSEAPPVTKEVTVTRTTSPSSEPAVPPSPYTGPSPTTKTETDSTTALISTTTQTLVTNERRKNDDDISWPTVGTTVGIIIGIVILIGIGIVVIHLHIYKYITSKINQTCPSSLMRLNAFETGNLLELS